MPRLTAPAPGPALVSAAPPRPIVGAVPPALTATPDTRALLKALGRRWLLALCLATLGGAAVAVAAWTLLSPRYTAFAQVRVAALEPFVILPNRDTPEGRDVFDTYKRFQASELKSRFVLNDALKKDEVKRLSIIQEQPEPIPWLEEELKVETKEGQEIITLSMTGGDPEPLLVIVRAVLDSYMTGVVKKDQDDRRARLLKMQQAYNEARERLHKNRKTLRERVERAGGADPETLRERRSLLLTSLADLKKQHQQIEFDLLQARNRLKAHKASKTGQRLSVPKALLHQAMATDPQCQQLVARLTQLQDIIADYEERAVNPNEATLVNSRAMRAKVRRLLKARQARLKKGLADQLRAKAREEHEAGLAQLQVAVASLVDQEKALRTKLEEQTAQANKVSSTSTNMDLLEDEIKQDERFVADLWNKLGPLEIEVNSKPRVSEYQPADLQKVDMKRRIMAAALGPVAAVVGICFAVGWWEFRARRVQTEDEVTAGLGMPVVGAVPALGGLGANHLVVDGDVPDGRESTLLESIDAIRTRLLRDARVEATRVIMVTSAVPGEGKTTLAGNLATSLARAGRKTLLVDGDLRCPAGHQLFEQTLQPGLSEVLLGEVELAGALRPTTAAQGLSLLPAGQWDREVIQALARADVQQLFERLRAEFDFIILDAHPVLPAADALLLGQHADAVLLSLMRDVSRLPQVHAAAQRLANLGIRILGAVVNGVPGDAYAGEAQALAYSSR
jgi:capsular exopolysaccharide synthesis family protein